MKPAPFLYDRPTDEAELAALLAEWGEEAKVLAGGQSLLPLLNLRLARPRAVIDLNGMGGWDTLTVGAEAITLGSLVRHRQVVEALALAERLPILPMAARHIGHPVIRNRGTVGGSLAHADPAAEHGLVLSLLAGTVEVWGPRGTRQIPAQEWFVGIFTTAMQPDEVIRRIHYPLPPAGTGFGFAEVAETVGAFALVAAGAWLRWDAERRCIGGAVALAGLEAVPHRFPVPPERLGERWSEPWARALAEEMVAQCSPLDDFHARADTRRELGRVLIRRALAQAAEQGGTAG